MPLRRILRAAGGSGLSAAATWGAAGTAVTVVAGLSRVFALGFVHDGAALADSLFLTATVPATATVLRFGLERSGPRFIGHELGQGMQENAANGFRTVMRLAAGLGLFAAIVVVPVASLVALGSVLSTSLTAPLVVWLGLWLGLEIVRRPVAESARVYKRFAFAFLADAGPRGLAFSTAVVTSRFLGVASLTVTVALATVATAAAVVVPGVLVHRNNVRPFAKHPGPVRELVGLSPVLLVILLGAMLQATADLWVVSRFFDDGDRTNYLIAFQIATTFALVMQVENMTAQPFIARWARRGDGTRPVTAIAQLVATGGTAVVSLGLVAGLVALSVLPSSIDGIDVGQVAGLAAVLTGGQLINCASGPCGTLFIMSERLRVPAFVAMGVGVAAVVFEWLAGRAGLLYGVAAVSGGSVALQNLILAGLAKRQLGVSTGVVLKPSTLRRHVAVLREVDL